VTGSEVSLGILTASCFYLKWSKSFQERISAITAGDTKEAMGTSHHTRKKKKEKKEKTKLCLRKKNIKGQALS